MKTVLFDFDGVLLRGDSFALFLRRRALTVWRRIGRIAVAGVSPAS